MMLSEQVVRDKVEQAEQLYRDAPNIATKEELDFVIQTLNWVLNEGKADDPLADYK